MKTVPQGQLLPDSEFGRLLTELAKDSPVIVEIGTWFGQGSTLCLHKGLTQPNQRLISFEVDLVKVKIARKFFAEDTRVEIVHGTIVYPQEFQPFAHPDIKAREFYHGEFASNTSAPYRFDAIPPQIDLLLLDGGEWCAEVEFDKLIDRTRIIALDDTNPALAHKNLRNRNILINDPAWEIVHDKLDDRNGCTVARRMTG